MAISIEGLDADAIDQIEEQLVDAIKADYPSLDLGKGRVLRELLIRPAAIFHVERQTEIDELRQSMSLKAIEEDPTLADDDVVDGVLSNYRVERTQGTKASGYLTIVISALSTTTVPQGTTFTADGQDFTTDQTYVGVTEQEAVTSDQMRLISARTDGSYAFTIPVTAASAGSASQIRRNTRFTTDTSIAGVVDIFATQDFTGGTDTETNAQLIDRFNTGISPSTFAGRVQIEALVRETVTDTKDVSITGFGDAEMIRDQHNIFGMSAGGKADLWVRTQEKPESVTLVKEAVLIDVEEQLWQLSLTRDDFPGFYIVEAILPSASAAEVTGTLEITGESRSVDMTQETNEFVPDVLSIVEGAYSRYQTSIVQFKDPDTASDAEVGDRADYNVNVLGLLNVSTLQDVAVDRSVRNPQADYLVRAPVPAFVTINVTVLYKYGDEAPDADAIKAEIVSRVNALRFEDGQLPASVVHDAVHNIAGTEVVSVSPLDFMCQIRKPDGDIITIRDTDGIEIPNLPAEGVSSRTVAFFTDVDSVDVAVSQASVLPV
jgi:uncharacterized phage protein gp47/JayE